MFSEFANITIKGIASAVPKHTEENCMYESVLGKRRVKKQIQLTGIYKRHVAEREQRTSDLCYVSAVRLLDKLQWNKEEIGVLVFVTQHPNFATPSTAFFLQKRLELPKECLCFDVNLGCSGFNVGVQIVSSLLQSSIKVKRGLLLVGDTVGKILCAENGLTKDEIAENMMFGSAGSAIAIEKENAKAGLKTFAKSDGTKFDAIMTRRTNSSLYGLASKKGYMDGNAVFEFAVDEVSKSIIDFKRYFNINENDIDYYVFHQAQKLILDSILNACGIEEQKELRSLEEYGNTSGVSVPLTVCYHRDEFCHQDSVRMLLCGFGIGLSWGAVYAEIPTENILPIIETDEHYDEDKVPIGTLREKSILVVGADTSIGEYVARFCSKSGASILLAGKNKKKLLYMEADLFNQSYMIPYEEDSVEAAEEIISWCREKDIELDGVIFAEGEFIPDKRDAFCGTLAEKGALTKEASVVFLADVNMDIHSIKESIEKCQNKVNVYDIRVNAITYDNEELDLVQISGDEQEWVKKYLQNNCPKEMKRPLYVGRAVNFLLSDESQFTTGNVIQINR
ncbi:MAG: hypothetical protein J6B84_00815 [Eubacterium sp.]|mgnify:FL=1|nr:hypothetical protein [Eubacterium sp.]